MKKYLAVFTAAVLSANCYCATSPLEFSTTKMGVSYTITVTNWTVDKRDVPSFEYSYTQMDAKNGVCNYSVSGKATAGFEEDGGKVILDVYNPQNDDGTEGDPILYFSDGDKTITMAANEKKRNQFVTFESKSTTSEFNKHCLNGEKHLTVSFGKGHIPKK